jgi:hypothetical protein
VKLVERVDDVRLGTRDYRTQIDTDVSAGQARTT